MQDDDIMWWQWWEGSKIFDRNVPLNIVADGHDKDLLSYDQEGYAGDQIQNLTSLVECQSWQRLQQHNISLECVYHLEQLGRFDLASVNLDEYLAHFEDPCNESDISGSLQMLQDEWKAVYSEQHEGLRWQLLAVDLFYSPDSVSCLEEPCPEVHILNTETGPAIEGLYQNRPIFPIIANPVMPCSASQPRPIADLIADEFALNVEQWCAFALVTQQVMLHCLPPLQIFLGGPGGTGKTRLIHAIQEFFLWTGQAWRFRVCSLMGVAARNISGSTLHVALNLNERRGSRFSVKSRCDLIAKWEGVDFLLIDKVSVIGHKMFVSIHVALCITKGNNLPFGGVNIVFAGDFAQLPFV